MADFERILSRIRNHKGINAEDYRALESALEECGEFLTVAKCNLCFGTGSDPFLDRLEDGLWGPAEVRDYCRLCQGEGRVVDSDRIWAFVEEIVVANNPVTEVQKVQVTRETPSGPQVFLVDPAELEPVSTHDKRLDRLYAVILKAHETPGSQDICPPDPWSQAVWDLFYVVRQILAADGRKLP